MAELTNWIKESEKYEFCRSYGIPAEGEFVICQEDYYIALLGNLHDILNGYFKNEDPEKEEQLKHKMLDIVKGLLLYSQKETSDAFHGVRVLNNQLYVASLYYLCDYAAISSWVMSDVQIDEYDDKSSQMLSFIVTGGRSVSNEEIRLKYMPVFKSVEDFIQKGDDTKLEAVVSLYNTKYDNRDFGSPTDFYMTNVLRCVLKKFQRDNIWQSLRRVDATFDWTVYARHSYRQHILSFLPSQQDAIDKGLLTYTGSFSLKMPTSAGKSYITELLIHHEIKSNPNARVLYLAPLRALSRELRDRFRKIHKGLGFTYATKYGGSAASIVEDGLDDAQLLVATPESFLSIESSSQAALDSFTLVICDEGQLLEDISRGINYEMLLSRLRRRNNARFLFISAIIPNINVVNRWLKGTDSHIGDSSYRPSKLVLTEALVSDDGVDLNVYDQTYNGVSFSIPNFITKTDAQNNLLRDYDKSKRKWKKKANPVGCTLALRSLSAGPVLLFATGKTMGICCAGLTKFLVEMLGNGAIDTPLNYVNDTEKLKRIIEYASFQLGADHLLCVSLQNGFAYHHGDIPQDLREKIERAYDKGVIRLIISNTTLAEGINLPVKTIVLAGVFDQSNQKCYLPNSRLKNIIGRVGRAGRERYGTIIAPSEYPNGKLIQLLREALYSDDSALEKMRGTLYALVDYLVKRDKVKNENDINELLSVTIFSDAIDEMIIRSADGDVNEIDIEDLVSESLAYTLSDEVKKDALKKVFKARHNVLKQSFEDKRYRLSKSTGLNLRELDTVERFVSVDHVTLASELDNVTNGDFVSFVIDAIMDLPTIKEDIEDGSATRRKLLSITERIKRVAVMWMEGMQYWEIAEKESIKVDEAILIVIFLQGVVHDKAEALLAYLNEAKGFEKGIATYWPEYLRLGIDDRLMYEAHKLRIPERIQLHAIKRFYEETESSYGDYANLESSLTENKGKLEKYMKQKGYPVLSIEGLMEVLNYLGKK